MRIIFLLAAAMGAAAIGGPAEAQSQGGFSGPGAGSSGRWAPGSGYHAGSGGHFHLRPGIGRGDRPHRRFGRRRGDSLYPSGGFGSAGSIEAANPYDSGYYAEGGRVRLRDGRPYYDYDRSYPYEWASAAAGGDGWDEAAGSGPPSARCTFENGVRVCRGGPPPGR
jgi:hypothetical protein